MYNNINLNLLKYFYEVVNSKHITLASQKLLISQPAVTKVIKDLELELESQVKLLERSKKGVIPTPEGKILYEHIKDMFKDLNSTLISIECTKQKGETLYIGATITNFMNFIIDTLKEFRQNILI